VVDTARIQALGPVIRVAVKCSAVRDTISPIVQSSGRSADGDGACGDLVRLGRRCLGRGSRPGDRFWVQSFGLFKGKAHASQFAAASVGQRQCRPLITMILSSLLAASTASGIKAKRSYQDSVYIDVISQAIRQHQCRTQGNCVGRLTASPLHIEAVARA
jgi:hypothetical protein